MGTLTIVNDNTRVDIILFRASDFTWDYCFMTKNIYEIDHLVDKQFLPAVLKRLEMAATNNEVEKIGELRRIGLEIIPIEYMPELKAKMDEIVDVNSPKLVRRHKLTV